MRRRAAELTAALLAASPGLDVDATAQEQLAELPPISRDGARVLRAASELASSYDTHQDGQIHVSHLFGGILRSIPATEGYNALRTVLGAAQSRAGRDYADFLSERVGNRWIKYGEFLTRHPLVPATAARPRPRRSSAGCGS